MNLFLVLAFLFSYGSVTGWVVELLFRRFISSSNPERKWINPGFCTGPYLPLYGFGQMALYLLASMERFILIENPVLTKIILFLVMAVCLTGIEYIAGIFCLKLNNVRLWDYSREWGNIQGIICPKFSLAWALMGALYYFLIHPQILEALDWLSRNLAFSFLIGLFYGYFTVDVAHASDLLSRMKAYADDNNVIIQYETVKENFHKRRMEAAEKMYFFRPLHLDQPISYYLEDWKGSFEKRIRRTERKE